MSGSLIVLEGVEGAGKTTQVPLLMESLARMGVECVAVREPGGTPTGDAIRAILLDPSGRPEPETEALLFLASRSQLVREVIRPALQRGVAVIADRFLLSTYAYQVAGRGLSESEVRAANGLATGGLVPGLNIVLDLPPAEGLQRISGRGIADRIERSGREFHERVAEAFREFARLEWQREHPEAGPVVLVDASGDKGEVAARVAAAVSRELGAVVGAEVQ